MTCDVVLFRAPQGLLVACPREKYQRHAGGRERGAPPGAEASPVTARFAEHPGVPAARGLRGGVARWGCSRPGPAFAAVEVARTVYLEPADVAAGAAGRGNVRL